MSEIDYKTMDDPETFVPHHMRGGYKLYVEHGISPGSFGSAILEQDVEKARRMADHINAGCIDTQIAWVKKYVPQNTEKEMT